MAFIRLFPDEHPNFEDIERQRDQFLSIFAHGLRNPLAPVMNGLHVLRMTGAEPEVQEQARALIERQIRLLTRIINDLLEVSRLSRGKIKIKKEPVDLHEILRTVVEEHRSAFEGIGVSIHLHLEKIPGWVVGETSRLTQVFNQLLDNALQFTDEGDSVTLSLSYDKMHRQAVMTISDTGIGIERETLPTLFDMFSQADRHRHRGKKGLGIGLTLVKGLVEQHGGQIEAKSGGIDQGAEFTIRLPALDELPVMETEGESKAANLHQRIVIIEDNKDAADSLRMLLEFLGHEVRVAYTGLDGVKLAEEWEPAVVLSDIGLPGLDGWGVARELRQHPATHRTRLIAITAYGMDSDRNMSSEAGFKAHLIKPVDIDELRKLLAKK